MSRICTHMTPPPPDLRTHPHHLSIIAHLYYMHADNVISNHTSCSSHMHASSPPSHLPALCDSVCAVSCHARDLDASSYIIAYRDRDASQYIIACRHVTSKIDVSTSMTFCHIFPIFFFLDKGLVVNCES